MRSLFRLVLAAVLAAAPGGAWAQVKFKRCLSPTEIQVEQLVRHGVFLRESAGRCNEVTPGSAKTWRDFDQRFGPRLKLQTDKRAKLFQREFRDNALKVRTYFDGRLVTYHRNVPITTAYCENVEELLTEVTKGGWGAFTTQAKTVQNEVLLDYKACQ